MYNIDDNILKSIIRTFEKYSNIKKVILFGSRVKNTSKKYSDIDLAIVGNFDILFTELIKEELENNIPTLLKFDCIDYNRIENQNLKEEIDKHGKIIYSLN